MILHREYNHDTGFIVNNLIEYNEEITKNSKMLLEKFRKEDILEGDFNDVKWILNDEYELSVLNFNFDEVAYTKESKERNMYTFEQFVDSVKSYVLLTITQRTGSTTKMCIYNLRKYIHETKYFNEKESKNLNINEFDITTLRYIEGYLKFVQFDGVEYYLDLIEEQAQYILTVLKNNNNDNRRKLADFQSIFLFNKIIEDFWENHNSEKEQYYPLYIWWKIASILPLRLKEFCITPYDCTEVNGDKYFLKLRRSKIKGRSGVTKSMEHKIDLDYTLKKYIITEEIVNLINEYKEITKKHREDYNLLLCYSTFKSYSTCSYKNKNFLNYTFRRENLHSLLEKFFVNVVQDIYGYELLSYEEFKNRRISSIDNENNSIELEFKPLGVNEITLFRPGDIRHYAMINMVLNDINPILVKELVDHEDINTTFHYFGNISELVKCMSYIKYKDICDNKPRVIDGGRLSVSSARIFNQLEATISVEVDNGYCTSKYFAKGELNHCITVDCECENCDFFIKEKPLSKQQIKQKLDILESNIQQEANLIQALLNSYNNTNRENRALTRNFLKLQGSIQLYCDESIKNGGALWEK